MCNNGNKPHEVAITSHFRMLNGCIVPFLYNHCFNPDLRKEGGGGRGPVHSNYDLLRGMFCRGFS